MAFGRRPGDGEWYTPPSIVEAARAAMGGIDCDPASNRVAQRVVRAGVYYSIDDDGLAQPWRGRVFLNPPWGIKARFIRKLADHRRRGDIDAAIVVLSHDISPQWYDPLAEVLSAICLMRDRVGTSITYVGDAVDRFAAAFDPLGLVVVPHRCPIPT